MIKLHEYLHFIPRYIETFTYIIANENIRAPGTPVSNGIVIPYICLKEIFCFS